MRKHPFVFLIEMKMARLSHLLIGLALVLPLFSFIRFAPCSDWYFSALAIAVLGVWFFRFIRKSVELRLTVVSVGLLLFALASAAHGEFHAPEYLSVLLLLFLFTLYFAREALPEKRTDFVIILSSVVFVAALLQALLGYIQIIGLAPALHGFILYDIANPQSNIMGNIGQRNQFAQFLTWGLAAACYLYASGRLRGVLFYTASVVLVLLITWSGARLILLYSLSLCMLAWFWLRMNIEDAKVQRMVYAVAVVVIIVAMVQIFNHQICQLLSALGLPINVTSGSERLMDAGLGARRRIEWSKAWEVFRLHPLFGVGLGGYAAESVRLEALGGWPKVPESWLFNQSHNLIFQLLAETGLAGCLVVMILLLLIVFGYLRRGQQTIENLFLLSVFSMIGIHSMFEYPLWYWPFLFGLIIIGVLAPLSFRQLQISPVVLRVLAFVVGIFCLLNFFIGQSAYWVVVRDGYPSPSVEENKAKVERLVKLGSNPFWRDDADSVLTAYLQPSREQLSYKLDHFERLAKIRPYPEVLFKLSILRSLARQPDKAKEALIFAIANYPDFVDRYVANYANYQYAELADLQTIAKHAAEAYALHGKNTDAGRIAAVMTVAAPVTRKAIF